MRYTNQQSSSSSVSVFSQTATLPLSAYLSHAHAGVTFPRRCCCRLTLAARVRQTAVRGVFRRHWTDRRTDVQTDGETDGRQTVAYPMLDAASGNNFHSLRIINIRRCFYTGVGGHTCMHDAVTPYFHIHEFPRKHTRSCLLSEIIHRCL